MRKSADVGDEELLEDYDSCGDRRGDDRTGSRREVPRRGPQLSGVVPVLRLQRHRSFRWYVLSVDDGIFFIKTRKRLAVIVADLITFFIF